MQAGDPGDRRDVDKPHVGVGGRFEEHHPSRRVDRCGEIGRVGKIHMRNLYAEFRQAVIQEAEGAAI